MFRVEFFVDDRKLGQALSALVGISHGDPIAKPVVNAVKTKNGLAAKTGGSAMERITEALAIAKGRTTDPAQFKEMMKILGIAPGGYHHYLTKSVQAKLLKKVGKGRNATYKVL